MELSGIISIHIHICKIMGCNMAHHSFISIQMVCIYDSYFSIWIYSCNMEWSWNVIWIYIYIYIHIYIYYEYTKRWDDMDMIWLECRLWYVIIWVYDGYPTWNIWLQKTDLGTIYNGIRHWTHQRRFMSIRRSCEDAAAGCIGLPSTRLWY